MDIELTSEQQLVFDKIKDFIQSDRDVFILKGYAGTGKTTLIKYISDYIKEEHNLQLMAPTGRAARVLSKKTGYSASTIHKGIYDNGHTSLKDVHDLAETEFIVYFPIASVASQTIIIVDEASMLSSQTCIGEIYQFGTNNLMNDLLEYVHFDAGGKIIFVGDPAQLPPVGDSDSKALNPVFFEDKGLKADEAELTEVLRQTGDSKILKNAMQIRDLLQASNRNTLVFEEQRDDVESLRPEEFVPQFIERWKSDGQKGSCVMITFSNRAAAEYNEEIRMELYGNDTQLRCGETLMVVQNNYALNRMNGEFIQAVSVGEKTELSAPVYVWENGERQRKTITLHFQRIATTDGAGNAVEALILLDLLYNGKPRISYVEQKALYINFCIRHPELKQGTKEFNNALLQDVYYNCLMVKFGYAVTGHKCQGGEWRNAFVDYSGRTGLSDDCLRWAYTATTRANKHLLFTNLPRITPFSKFTINELQRCTRMSDECQILRDERNSRFHSADASTFLHAKCLCIAHNMMYTPYMIANVVSQQYNEVYSIQTPDGIETFDLRYIGGGIFKKASSRMETSHTQEILRLLDDEQFMSQPLQYEPSNTTFEQLFYTIRSACDSLGIKMTNVVEHMQNYYITYYFLTSNTHSCLRVNVNANYFVTYAAPMSMLGKDDYDFVMLINEIKKNLI